MLLIADDDDDVRAFVSMVLALDGHEFNEASTVQGALRAVTAGESDAVVTDMSFGMESGLPIVTACLELGCPVIVMTASVSDDVLGPLVEAGVPVLSKPFSVEELLAAIHALNLDAP
jgi:DNA-binding response OmpR family regulator